MRKTTISQTIRPFHAPAESIGGGSGDTSDEGSATIDSDAPHNAESEAAQRAACIKGLRRATGLTQEEFCARFRIPLGTLRDWEQGRSEPDKPARAYLRAIAGDAAAVSRALEMGPH